MIMKTRLFITAALAVCLTGCIKDDRNNFMVDDSFGLTARSAVVEASVHTGYCSFGIAKNGKGTAAANVNIIVGSQAEDALKAYNAANKTELKAVPVNMYELPQDVIEYDVKDVVKEGTVKWNPATLSQYIDDDTAYSIPVLISSNKLKVNPDHSLVIIHLSKSTLCVEQAQTSRSIDGRAVEPNDKGVQPELKETITLDLSMDHEIKNIGFSLPVAIDNSLVNAFSQSQEEDWFEAPEGLVTVSQPKISIPEGKNSATFQIMLDKGKLPFKDGKLQKFPNYVVPVAIQPDKLEATCKGEPFALKGLGLGNTVNYVCVSYAKNGISVVVREWGFYSQAGAWYKDLDGFSLSADRTIAMDDEYVYVSHSNGAAPGIYALSRSNGSFVRKLDVSTAAGNNCTLPVSCVRVIPNQSGKDILCFCSLKEDNSQHLFVYAYVNGTDAAPVQILDFLKDNKGNANDWRRYGDRFTVEGTWQSGKLWFMTWHDGTYGKLLGFHIENGKIVNPEDPEDYYIPSDAAGIKDVTRYPEWGRFLITRNGRGNVYVPGAVGANGWIGLDNEQEIKSLSLAYGFNFFTFHSENYIAYMQLDGENAVRGKLVILDNKAQVPSELPAQLQWDEETEGVRLFPIQDPEDFEAKSQITASHSVGDCTVRYIDGNTYVAVMMQGCGLSLFQLQ